MSKANEAKVYPCVRCGVPIRKVRVLKVEQREGSTDQVTIEYYCECYPSGRIAQGYSAHLPALRALLGSVFNLPYTGTPMPQPQVEREVEHWRWELGQVRTVDEFLELVRLNRH